MNQRHTHSLFREICSRAQGKHRAYWNLNFRTGHSGLGACGLGDAGIRAWPGGMEGRGGEGKGSWMIRS